MPSLPPAGEPVPADGVLPVEARSAGRAGPLGLYVHVPFCRVRCGYCDFNTYVPAELRADPPGMGADPPGADTAAPTAQTADEGTDPGSYVPVLLRELDLSARVLGETARPVATVFVGGGTPTLLAVADLARVVAAIRTTYGLAPGAELTVEANPDTVTPASLTALAAAGFTRVSLGMQSAVPHVLATLDRTHEPANVARAVAAARDAGLATSLDLIYGTPGETLADWRASVEAAIGLAPDHVSAYALVVEAGTPLARRVARGEVAAPEDDDEADKYELADGLLAAAGYGWYEVSNWARTPAGVCRHNLGYWRGDSWWGLGPGAHGHVGGVRWWNVRHPRAYAERLLAGRSPGEGREVLTADQRYAETVLLRSRLAEGLALADLRPEGRTAVAGLIADGLIEPGPALRGAPAPAGAWDTRRPDSGGGSAGAERVRRVVLTRRGRLLADTVVHRLLG